MRKSVLFAPAALLLAAAPALAASPEKQTLSLENSASRVVDCALVVDGHTRTLLRMHPGQAWADDFDPRRDLRLVCERARKNAWRVRAGTAYQLKDGANRRVDLTDAAGG